MPFSRITITSEKNIGNGLQILKDSLTATEKKILITMLNSGMNQGAVRNKVFFIISTGKNTADVIIKTTVYSEILRMNQTITHKVKIKYS